MVDLIGNSDDNLQTHQKAQRKRHKSKDESDTVVLPSLRGVQLQTMVSPEREVEAAQSVLQPVQAPLHAQHAVAVGAPPAAAGTRAGQRPTFQIETISAETKKLLKAYIPVTVSGTNTVHADLINLYDLVGSRLGSNTGKHAKFIVRCPSMYQGWTAKTADLAKHAGLPEVRYKTLLLHKPIEFLPRVPVGSTLENVSGPLMMRRHGVAQLSYSHFPLLAIMLKICSCIRGL